jgi:hypothetical protein
MNSVNFEEMELIDGPFKVEWEYIGEGLSGDYDEEDEDDEPLLRFSCYEKVGENWEPIDDSSYCTQLAVTTPRSVLEHGLLAIMSELKDAMERGSGVKRAMEQMSWISSKDFEGARQ